MQPEIVKYIKFSDYLKDYFDFKRKTCRSFSYRQLAKRMGLLSVGSINYLLSGKRIPSKDFISRLGEDAGFSASEFEYAYLLREYLIAETDELKRLLRFGLDVAKSKNQSTEIPRELIAAFLKS